MISPWHVHTAEASENNFKFTIAEGAEILSNHDFLQLLKESKPFRRWYTRILSHCDFEAFFWENRPFTSDTMTKSHECNIVKSSYLASQSPDKKPFHGHFDDKKEVVHFSNLGNDAQLVVPVPKNAGDDFTHLGKFLRVAGSHQTDCFWKTVANETLKRISDEPVWLSTSGLGVFWLHARIDSYPKYYQTEEYRTL